MPARPTIRRRIAGYPWHTLWAQIDSVGYARLPALLSAEECQSLRALYDDNPHPQWRALWALTAVDRSGSETVPLFLDALGSPEPLVVYKAALGLAFFDRVEARPALLEGLRDPVHGAHHVAQKLMKTTLFL